VTAPVAVLLVAASVWSLRRARHHAVVRRRLGPAARRSGGAATVPLLAEGRLPPPRRVAAALAATDHPLDPSTAWTAWVATAVVALPVALAVGGPGLVVAVVALLAGGPVLAAVALGDRADRRYEDALPDALERVAGALRSGASPRRAVEEAGGPGPVGGDLAAVAADAAAGEPLVAALDRWAERRPLPGVRLTVAALALGAETGGAHARALDGVAATLRGRRAVAGEVRALAAQARLSGLVITVAPVGFGVVAAASDPRTATFLLRTPLGLACLVAGLALNAGAAVWMHRLAEVEP
jgi:tight adherence protein B